MPRDDHRGVEEVKQEEGGGGREAHADEGVLVAIVARGQELQHQRHGDLDRRIKTFIRLNWPQRIYSNPSMQITGLS